MGRFLVRRIISSIITLFLFAIVVFFVAKVMMPWDFGISPERPTESERFTIRLAPKLNRAQVV